MDDNHNPEPNDCNIQNDSFQNVNYLNQVSQNNILIDNIYPIDNAQFDDNNNISTSNDFVSNNNVFTESKPNNDIQYSGIDQNKQLDSVLQFNFIPKPGMFQKIVHSRDTKTLKEFIFSPFRCSINEKDASGCTALHIALLNAYPDILEILLSSPTKKLTSSSKFTENINNSDGNINIPLSSNDNICSDDKDDDYEDQMKKKCSVPLDLTIPCSGVPISHLVLSKAVFPEKYQDCIDCLNLILQYSSSETISPYISKFDINSTDQLGLTCLHLACSFGDPRIVSLLIEHGAIVTLSDLSGEQPVHHAISSRDPSTLSVVLSSGGSDPLKESTSTASLIKYCIDKSAWRCLHTLLTDTEYQQHPISESEYDLLSFHAQKLGLGTEFSRIFAIAVEIATNESCSQSTNESYIADGPSVGLASTRVFTHKYCFNHIMLPEPMDLPIRRSKLINKIPENPTRLEVLVKPSVGILRSNEFSLLQWTETTRPALLSDVLRVHDWAYIRLLQHKVEESRLVWEQRPFFTGSIDDDTQLTPESWKAALYASGSVLNAIDSVCRGENRNAFCAIRPPGHHLGTWGAAQNVGTDEGNPSGSQGFCLLNNIAIGAAYCRYMYGGHGISKIAIIDFDVHHGNGTEQIVRNVCPNNRKIRSTLSPFPGVNVNIEQDISYYKIWRDEEDADNVFFSSVHAYDGIFYPGTGQDEYVTKPTIVNIGLPERTTSKLFRYKIRRYLLPKLLQFRPDIIFISAGFDGHVIDSVGKGFTSFTENDYSWFTQQLISIANLCCNGRIVSVLEGGYNTKCLNLSPLAKSVAAHIRTLQWTSPNLMPNPQEWEDDFFDNDDNSSNDENAKKEGYNICMPSYVEHSYASNGEQHINLSSDESNHNVDHSVTSSYYERFSFNDINSSYPVSKKCKTSNEVEKTDFNGSVNQLNFGFENGIFNSRPKRAAAIKAEESIQKKIQSELEQKKNINTNFNQ
ncbi:hypothetical protein FG386_001916 [Cryptosporidium ryanae]|uniref:uncharacterized protein n=1 Tax=Cryptosporidium ryanae TaxID=515981 RepID=UPI00351A4B61|nr:hypothetical protein FG386_001916 [Cryptosporidium ryanae]